MDTVQMGRPTVSVIMNCHNSGKYLREAIDSVLAQTYLHWEVVFWDNQSTDDSADIFKSYNDPRLRYFFSSEYTALGEARNLAMRQARGKFIAFLDCDDLWFPKKLEKQIPLFDKSAVGLVICDTVFFNDKKDIRQLYRKKKPPVGCVFREILGAYFISMETPVIRKSLLEGMDHWFDIRFEVIEEYDFFVRVGYEWEVAYVDEVLAKWRVHGNSWTWSRPELFPAETRLFLDKLRGLIPDFDADYAMEISAVMTTIALHEAVVAWRNGNVKEACSILEPFSNKNVYARLISLWARLLPFKTFDFAYRMRIGLTS
ncbi:glycosyltransferase family 2 protein [Desulfobacula sp.]|uniref:glycosyltransferase family 2 protein n=1 Tax=Desulfobacula sp. TaxID=2593537 RepID=UPI001EC91CC7|nr:glycosyltransferase family 2 protein [Desulfobacula sp.]